MTTDAANATVTRTGALDMQVCVPGDWTDDQIEQFANHENICGTANGWKIRKQGDAALVGKDERVKCQGGAAGNVHIMLDA